MTRYELIQKTVPREGFEWDGTPECLRGHLSDEELDTARPRVCKDEHGPFAMIQTLHDPSRIRPGDWIVIVRWPGTGVEIYAIKPHVRDAAYELGAAIPFDPVEES